MPFTIQVGPSWAVIWPKMYLRAGVGAVTGDDVDGLATVADALGAAAAEEAEQPATETARAAMAHPVSRRFRPGIGPTSVSTTTGR